MGLIIVGFIKQASAKALCQSATMRGEDGIVGHGLSGENSIIDMLFQYSL